MSEAINCIQCDQIGVSTDGVVIEEITNCMGQHYFKAKTNEIYLFGSKVEGELVGLGRTKEDALKRLHEEEKRLADSLWE